MWRGGEFALSVCLCWKGYLIQRIPNRSTAKKLHRVYGGGITGVAGDCTEFRWVTLHRVLGVRKKYSLEIGKIAQSLRLHRVLIWVFWE